MHEAALDDLLGRDSGPIAPHIEALARERALPSLAIALCAARIEEAAPAFMAVLQKAARGEALSEAEARLLFRGLHLLGGGRHSEAFAPLMRLLRRPDEELEALLGDALTETLPRIIAGVFDGDDASLFAFIEDQSRDEFLRGGLLAAAAFLAWDGKIDHSRTTQFLVRFYAAGLAPAGDFAWTAWADAVALLGEDALADTVRRAFEEKRVEPFSMHVSDFERALSQALRAPRDIGRFEHAHLGYVEDVLVELERFPEYDPHAAGGLADWTPEINPFRHVGRNDPCPCGSGKKFKKCCLA